MKHPVRILALPMVLIATLALASCGNSMPARHGEEEMSDMTTTETKAAEATGAPATGAKNDTDIAFATGMIHHHTQAIEMADMALKQATDPKIKALAPKIKAAQSPENTRMSGWLKGWRAPVPETGGGHEMSGMGDPVYGMMSAQEMTDLGAATGSGFDRMWLQMMIKHHKGAVAMANVELAKGTNPEAKQLAQAVIDSQSAEITEMTSILTRIPS